MLKTEAVDDIEKSIQSEIRSYLTIILQLGKSATVKDYLEQNKIRLGWLGYRMQLCNSLTYFT